MDKQLRDITAENRKLVEPLQQAQAEVTELNRRMQNYEKDKMSLVNTKKRLDLCQKKYDGLKWENEVLELRFEKVSTKQFSPCIFINCFHFLRNPAVYLSHKR